MRAEYLGDGVYVEPYDVPGGVTISTRNGRDILAEIVFEPEIWDKLVEYVTRLRAEQRA